MSVLRHLVVDLEGELTGPPRPWVPPEDALEPLGAWGGVAAGLAGLARGDLGLQLAIGPAVVSGVATAARLTVLGRSPLTGRPAEGQVGSDLARRLAGLADLVTLRGRTDLTGAVLVLGDRGASLRSFPDLVGRSPAETHARLVEHLGPLASLRIGPAGESGVAWANLAAGAEPESFVGRGGLGALLASHGLKAIAVCAPPLEAGRDDSLERALLASPRLRARARGGTFELAQARVASGDLSEEVGQELGETLKERRAGRHGCAGCPTPCGWTFARDGEEVQGARFSAVHALGAQLGLGAQDALELLETCNLQGLDAKEAAAGLGVMVEAGEVTAGDRAGFVHVLERVGRGEVLEQGAGPDARARGLEDPTVGGEALRDESDPAVWLAGHVAVRGAEPMRSSAGLLATSEAASPGREVWWHENLSAALDASGFCSFAAAGVLADRVLSLDQLAAALSPGLDGEGLLARGAVLVALVAEAGERLGVAREAPVEAGLLAPQMWPAYRTLRGLSEDGALLPDGLAHGLLRSPRPSGKQELPMSGPTPAESSSGPTGPGSVELGASGALGEVLGTEVELVLPAPLIDVLRAAAERWPKAAPLLLDGDRLLPAVYRGGIALGPRAEVGSGERLDLVLAIAGG